MIRLASTGGEASPLQSKSLSEQPETDLSQAFEIEDMRVEEEGISCSHNSTLPTPKLKLQMSHLATGSEALPSQSQSLSEQPDLDLSEAFEIEDTEGEEEITCNSGFMIPSSLNLKIIISGLKISESIRSRPLHKRIIELRNGISLNPSMRKKQKNKSKEIKHKKNTNQTRLSPLSQSYLHCDENSLDDSKITEN